MSFSALRIDISKLTIDSSDTEFIEFYTAARRVDTSVTWSEYDGYPTYDVDSRPSLLVRIRITQSYPNGLIIYLPFQVGNDKYTFTTNEFTSQSYSNPQSYFPDWCAWFKYNGASIDVEYDSESCVEVHSVMLVSTTRCGAYNRSSGAIVANYEQFIDNVPSDYITSDNKSLYRLDFRNTYSLRSTAGISIWPGSFYAHYGKTSQGIRYLNYSYGGAEIQCDGFRYFSPTIPDDPGLSIVCPVLIRTDYIAKHGNVLNTAKYVSPGSTYSTSVTADTGYKFISSRYSYYNLVRHGNSNVTPSAAYSSEQFNITISPVTDVIKIFPAVFPKYGTEVDVIHNLTHCYLQTPVVTKATTGSYLRETIIAYAGAIFKRVRIQNGMMLYSDQSEWVTYNEDNTQVSISFIDLDNGYGFMGDITITAEAKYPEVYSITNTLTNCSTDNSDVSITEQLPYQATITANTGYIFDASEITVTMGSSSVTPILAEDRKSFTIDISSVTGNLTITASPHRAFSVTNNLTHCTTNNSDVYVEQGNSYSATLTADRRYRFSTSGNVVIGIGSATIIPQISTPTNSLTVNLTASQIDGDITITASPDVDPTPPEYWVVDATYSHCSTNNQTIQVTPGASYEATVTAENGYYFDPGDVTVTMGGSAVSPIYGTKNKSFTITIASVTEDISISAIASESADSYAVTNTLTNCSTNNLNTRTNALEPYSAVVTASSGYYFRSSDITVTMKGKTITPILSASGKTCTIEIGSVNGAIVITGTAIVDTRPTPPVDKNYTGHWEYVGTNQTAYDVVASSIRQTATEIELKVSQDELISAINLSPETIHLETTGRLIIDSGNFTVNADGYITATHATLRDVMLTSSGEETYENLSINSGVISFNNDAASIMFDQSTWDHQRHSYLAITSDEINLLGNGGDGLYEQSDYYSSGVFVDNCEMLLSKTSSSPLGSLGTLYTPYPTDIVWFGFWFTYDYAIGGYVMEVSQPENAIWFGDQGDTATLHYADSAQLVTGSKMSNPQRVKVWYDGTVLDDYNDYYLYTQGD